MTAYDKSKPASTESPRGGDDAIRNLAAANQEINNIDHYWPLNGSQVDHADKGKHRHIQFVDAMTSGSFSVKSLAVTSGEDALVYKNNAVEVEIVMSGDSLTSGALCLDGSILRNNKKMQFINTSGDALLDLVAIETYTHSGNVTLDRVFLEGGLRTSGEICLSGNLITNVADPISNQDAATKAYITAQLAAQSGTAKAWVSFNGTGGNGAKTPTASFNITSVTKNDTGDYTVTWATDFGSANYVVQITASNTAGGYLVGRHWNKAAGTFRFRTVSGGSYVDGDIIDIVAFGAQ